MCTTYLFLASLLFSHNYTIATATLYLAHLQRTPSLLPSLEYLLHCALNSNDHFFLISTLQLLAHLPQFTHLLICCLRKQERSTWPFAIHKPSDILHLFNGFLLKNDLEYATTTIAILQGLLCSLHLKEEGEGEGDYEKYQNQDGGDYDSKDGNGNDKMHTLSDSLEEREEMEKLKALFQSSNPVILSLFPFLFEPPCKTYCIAHRSGLQLLLTCLTLKQYDMIPDIYRFLVMEVCPFISTLKFTSVMK